MRFTYTATIDVEIPTSMVAKDFLGILPNSAYKSAGSFVYLIRNIKRDHYKIGTTTNIISRFNQLQTASSEKLELVGLIVGNYDTEQQIHFYLNPTRLVGEWFTRSRAMFWLFKQKSDFQNVVQSIDFAPEVLKKQILLWKNAS